MDGEIIIRVPKRVRKGIWPFRRWVTIWREQGFLFTLQSWMMMSDHYRLPLNELDALKEHFMKGAMYHAAQWWNIYNRRPIDFNEIDVKLWDDTIPNRDYQALLQTIADSRIGGERISDLVSADEKKKSGQTT